MNLKFFPFLKSPNFTLVTLTLIIILQLIPFISSVAVPTVFIIADAVPAIIIKIINSQVPFLPWTNF